MPIASYMSFLTKKLQNMLTKPELPFGLEQMVNFTTGSFAINWLTFEGKTLLYTKLNSVNSFQYIFFQDPAFFVLHYNQVIYSFFYHFFNITPAFLQVIILFGLKYLGKFQYMLNPYFFFYTCFFFDLLKQVISVFYYFRLNLE